MKVLLAVDGSAYTKRMLAYLASRDDMLGQHHEYTAITVVPKVPPHAARFLSSADLNAYYAEEAAKALQPVKDFMARQGWAVQCQSELGRPADVIAATATAGNYNLLVMGSHGQSALGNLVLGSVASGVLAQCQTPVLLIR